MRARTLPALFALTAMWPITHAATTTRDRGAAAPAISMIRTVRPAAFPPDLIVGRSRCGDVTWLLTTGHDLIEVATGTLTAAARKVSGLFGTDRPWGLACLDDRSVWTLANPRTLVRLTGDGGTHERVPLTLPRTALFGAGDRLLFQQLPVVTGTDALMTSPPTDPAAVRAWSGLVQRAGGSRAEEVARNLVNCGLGAAGSVPCWFADETRVVVSNGRTARTVDASRLASRTVDAIHDVALTPHGLWLLARDRGAARLAATALLFIDDRSAAASVVDLGQAARLVLAASDTSCLLLTGSNQFVEASFTR